MGSWLSTDTPTIVDESKCMVRMSRDGNTMAICLENGDLLLQNTHSGKTIATLPQGAPYGKTVAIVFSPDERWLAVCVATTHLSSLFVDPVDPGVIHVWDRKNNTCVTTHDTPFIGLHHSFGFSPDSRLLTSGIDLFSGTVQLWCVDNNWFITRVLDNRLPGGIADASFSCDSRTLLCAGDILVLWSIPHNPIDAITARRTDRLEPLHYVPSVCRVEFSPVDAAVFAIGSADRGIYIAHIREDNTISVQRRFCDYTLDSVVRLSFSPCGRQLASRSLTCDMRVWDVASGKCLYTLPNTDRSVDHDITFLTNGQQLVVTRYVGELRVIMLCKWSERTHHLFCPDFRRRVVWVLCARARLAKAEQNMPYDIWRMIFQSLL